MSTCDSSCARPIDQDFAPDDVQPSLGVELDRARIDAVFLLENARRQRCFGVVGKDRHHGLNDDRPLVAFFVDEMHRAAGKAHAMLERFFLHVQTGKRRQQAPDECS